MVDCIRRFLFRASSKLKESHCKRKLFVGSTFVVVHLFGKLLEVLLKAIYNAALQRNQLKLCIGISTLSFPVVVLFPHRIFTYPSAVINRVLFPSILVNMGLIMALYSISKRMFP